MRRAATAAGHRSSSSSSSKHSQGRARGDGSARDDFNHDFNYDLDYDSARDSGRYASSRNSSRGAGSSERSSARQYGFDPRDPRGGFMPPPSSRRGVTSAGMVTAKDLGGAWAIGGTPLQQNMKGIGRLVEATRGGGWWQAR